MRENIREFVRVVTETIELPEPIVEIGSYQVEGQASSSDLRPLLAGKQYLGCDVQPGRGVDQIEDVHRLSFSSRSVGTVLMLETLEHVKNPLQAMVEVFRVLQPHGVVVISSCMDFPVHEYPADYWRFTPQGFDLLLERFIPRRVYVQGHPRFPHSLAGVGRKGGSENALHLLDSLVPEISGTLTQEISPRLGADPFRRLGESLGEGERWYYPEEMLHVAYDRLLRKDEEIEQLLIALLRSRHEPRSRRGFFSLFSLFLRVIT